MNCRVLPDGREVCIRTTSPTEFRLVDDHVAGVLPNGELLKVDVDDLSLVAGFHWGLSGDGFVATQVRVVGTNKKIRLDLIKLLVNKLDVPYKRLGMAFVDGDRTNCRRRNLLFADEELMRFSADEDVEQTVHYAGRDVTLNELAEIVNVPACALAERMRLGWSLAQAVMRTPWEKWHRFTNGVVTKTESKCGQWTKFTVDGDEATAVLEGGVVLRVDATDLPLVAGYWWHVHREGPYVYANIVDRSAGRRKLLFVHRLIMDMHGANWLEVVVDHINGDGFDNRRANLRVCSNADNRRNHKRNVRNTSGVDGVSYSASGNAWSVTCGATGFRTTCLDFLSAVALRRRLEREVFGEFLRVEPVDEHTCPVCRRGEIAEGQTICAHCREMTRLGGGLGHG